MGDHFTLSEYPERWNDLYSLVGLIAVENSSCHWLVFEMFRIALKWDRYNASGLYYALRAEAGQRDMTLTVLRDRMKAPEELELFAKIKSAFDRLGKATGRRNGFVHTPWSMLHSSGEFVPMDGARLHPQIMPDGILAQAMALIEELQIINRDLNVLCDELENLPSMKA